MTNEQKKQLLLYLIKIEENGEIFNFTRAERAEFQKWVDGLIGQEPCEDAISRQEVLYLIADNDLSMGQVVRGIHALPPVTPQELRKGHWIFDGDCLICSKCKKAYTFSGSNFCPNCGADMRESEVEDDKKTEEKT